jgi:hypothetical protein
VRDPSDPGAFVDREDDATQVGDDHVNALTDAFVVAEALSQIRISAEHVLLSA